MMRPVAALCLCAATLTAANAASWRSGGGGGGGTASVSLSSSNSLAIGNRQLEYHPTLTISCHSGDDQGWSQTVRVRDLRGSGTLPVSIQIDGRKSTEQWDVGPRGGSLVRSGKDGVDRLLKAKQLSLSWSSGYFSGSGQAVFNLAGISDAVEGLIPSCGQ